MVGGEDLADMPAAWVRDHVGVVLQEPFLFSRTIEENIGICGASDAEIRAAAVTACVDGDITRFSQGYDTMVGERGVSLSGGQKQRVAIARSLAMDPKILLCDEATSALDPTTTRSILALLKEINQKYGITIVIITHEMGVVQEICSHVAIIEQGELAETGTVEEVFSSPKSKAAKKLVFRGERKYSLMKSKRCIRIVFTENSSFEPVIANMVLECRASVNILLADTQDVGGTARGQMVLQLPEDEQIAEKMIQYLKDRNLAVEELDDYVE